MDYCKITTDSQAMRMPNPYRMTVANPTEEKKAIIASMDNWLPMQYTEQPAYDPETQYLTESWVARDGVAVQVWTVNDLPDDYADA